MEKISIFILKKSSLFLGILLMSFFVFWPSLGFAAIDLSSGSWETTFNCSDWTQYSDPLNCDGISKKGAWTSSPEGYYEEIRSEANYPGGGGGKGQRHWIGDGTNNNSGSIQLNFSSPQSNFWMRWYQRWESGFDSDWDTFKNVWFEGDDGTRHVLRPSPNQMDLYATPGLYYYSNVGYGSDFYNTGISDGAWQAMEVHLDVPNKLWEVWINGEKKISQINVDFGTTNAINYVILPENMKNVSNGRSMYVDFDDIKISNKGYIGPISNSSYCGDGTCNSGESCTSCSSDCGVCTSSGIDLSGGYYETTYDCSEWTSPTQALNCDGLGKKGNYSVTYNGSTHYEEIVAAANNPSGNGGLGQRHYIGYGSGDGNYVMTGGITVPFEKEYNKLWIRWYQRWEKGFGTNWYLFKNFYFRDSSASREAVFHFDGDGSIDLNPPDYGTNTDNVGYGYNFYPGGVSDGSWQMFEIHIDVPNNTFKAWVNEKLVTENYNVDYSGVSGFKDFLLPSNSRYLDTQVRYVDYDDLAISTNGYIGPVAGVTKPLYCGDGVCSSNESCSACPSDCGACPVDPVCGNSIVETGEDCDDGNTVTETCVYGQTSCTVCGSTCQNVAGASSYCGDGSCDSLLEDVYSCSSDCGLPDPNIFFSEGFEDSDLRSRSWYDSTNLNLSSTEKYSGNSSVEYHFKAGATNPDISGGAIRRLFTESDEVYVSFYIKYSDNWTGSDHNYHPHQFYILTNKDTQWTGPAYTYLTAYIEANEGYPMLILQDGKNINLSNINKDLIGVTEDRAVSGCNGVSDAEMVSTINCYPRGDGTYANSKMWRADQVYFQDSQGEYYKNDWHRVEAYFKMNSIINGTGQADGVIRYWLDDKLLISQNNVLMRTGQNVDMKFNQFMIAPYIGDGSPVDQSFWVDELQVGKSRPGTVLSQCGNGVKEEGEQCDDGNTITESCDYGETACRVCSANCEDVAGEVSYCGDGSCFDGETCETCSVDCGQCAIENILPLGSIDSVSQTNISGWAYDENIDTEPLLVHIYLNGTYHGQVLADLYRSDLMNLLGSADHGFSYAFGDLAPGDYEVRAYAINQPQGDNPELLGSPRTFSIQAPDTSAPTGSLSINSGAATTETQSVYLSINAQDDGVLASMKVSNSSDFNSVSEEAYKASKYWNLSAGEGIKTVYLWLKDEAGNWSEAISDNIELVSVYPDISGIMVDATSETGASISWQASGANYCEVYYGLNNDTNLLEVATEESVGFFSVDLTGLSSATQYSFYVSCENEYSNTSISQINTFNTKTSPVIDTIAPSQITDLVVENNGPNSVVLYWTSPGDDANVGLASQYDIRYMVDRISDSNWNQAIQLSQEPAPKEANNLESYIVVGLEADSFYHFAIKTSDENSNWSVLSNIGKTKTDRGDESVPGAGDKTPPGQAKKTDSYSSDSEALLTWENPDDADYTKTVVLSSEEPFQAESGSGDLLALHQGVFYTAAHSDELLSSKKEYRIAYEGTREYYRDTGLENGKTYYYAIITMDGVPNYSEPVFLELTPNDHKQVIEKAKKEIKRLKEEYRHLANVNRRLVESVSEDEAEVVYNHDQFVNLSHNSIKLYENIMSKKNKAMSTRQKYALAYFIEYGTPTTDRLGSGERAGVLNSYVDVYGHLPRSSNDYQDIIKIANGRWPSEKSYTKREAAQNQFETVYKRSDDTLNNENDNAAITIMTYGLRPAERNLESEKNAIKTFENIYGRGPANARDWDTVRAIAYSGAVR